MPPLPPDHDSRTDSFTRKRAHTKYSVSGDVDSILSTKRRRQAAVNQHKVQDFLPQGDKLDTHNDVLAQAGGYEDNSVGRSDMSDLDVSSGGEQQETNSDGDFPISSTKQRDATQTVPRINWNAGAKSRIRTTLGGGEGNGLKPSLLEFQASPSHSTRPDRWAPTAKEPERDLGLKTEGANPLSSSSRLELHLLPDGSKEPGVTMSKRAERIDGQELTTNMVSVGANSNKRSKSPLRSMDTASNFEASPTVVGVGEEMETKTRNSLTASEHLDPLKPWLSLDVYTIICHFVHKLPGEHERCERIGRQKLYECKQINTQSEDFKAPPQEYQEGSLEKLRAHLFSYDLDLPQRVNVLELEQLAAGEYSRDGICYDPENQAEVIFFRHLDEQSSADPGRREAIHETEAAFTKHIIEGYQYDHLMCLLLTPDERYEKGIGSLPHIHPYRTPREYREHILGKCNKLLTDPGDPGNAGMTKLQRMTKVEYDKIMYEYDSPLAQQSKDKEDGDDTDPFDDKNEKRGEDGRVHDNSSACSGSSRPGCSSELDLEREIHEVEIAYWRDRISRDQYNEQRWKLYTAEEAKEKSLEWPRRRVFSPAGYRDNEFEYPGPARYEDEVLDDNLLEFGCNIQDAEREAAAKERFRQRIETKFPGIEDRQAEYRRWEKIREVEIEFYRDRISRDEYNERRYPLYTNSEIEERGIEWPLDHCQSPAGRRDDIFGTFVGEEPSYEARMEFHWPYPLVYEDTSSEVQHCELCIPLIEQQRIENAEDEKIRTAQRPIRAAEAKAEQEKRDSERAAKAVGVDKAKKKKKNKKNKGQAGLDRIQTTSDAASSEKGSKGSFAGNPQILSLSNSTEVSERDAESVELPRTSADHQRAQMVADKQYGLPGDDSGGSKDEGELSEVDVNSANPEHDNESGRSSRHKPSTTRKSEMDLESDPSFKHSLPGSNMVSPQPITVNDLSTPEKLLQSRYFGIMQAGHGNESSGNNLARCLVCAGEGHTGDSCPQLTCRICSSVNSHFTYSCPRSIRCDKCHERGHATNSCPSKLVRSEAADGLKCDLCQQKGHFENSCSRIWRTIFSSDPSIKVTSLPVFCYNCGASGHFGSDCRLRLGGPQSRSTFGGNSFSLDNVNCFLLTKYKIERKAEFSIKGRATHRIREDSESEEFFRPPVAGAAHSRHFGVGGSRERGNDRSPNRPIRVRMPDSYRARSPSHQSGPSSESNFRPQRGEHERKRSVSPPPRYPRDDWRDSRRNNYQGRGEGRGHGDSWQPPLPREPLPTSRGRGGRDRGRGRGYGGDVYRPMPSAANNARRQFRR